MSHPLLISQNPEQSADEDEEKKSDDSEGEQGQADGSWGWGGCSVVGKAFYFREIPHGGEFTSTKHCPEAPV